MCFSYSSASSEFSESKHSENQRKIICLCNKLQIQQLHVAMLAEIQGHVYKREQHQTLYRVILTEAAPNIIQGHLDRSSTKHYTESSVQKQHQTLYRVICTEAAPNIIQGHLYRSSSKHYTGSSYRSSTKHYTGSF